MNPRVKPVMPDKIYSCAEQEDYASPEDEEMCYPGIKLPKEFPVYQTFNNTKFYEIPYPAPKGVESILRLTAPPNVQKANKTSIKKNESYHEGYRVDSPWSPGNIPKNFTKCFHCFPSKFWRPRDYIITTTIRGSSLLILSRPFEI